MTAPFHPIIYVRGFAGTQGGIEDTVADPCMGFNIGSAKCGLHRDGTFVAMRRPGAAEMGRGIERIQGVARAEPGRPQSYGCGAGGGAGTRAARPRAHARVLTGENLFRTHC